MVSMSQQNGVSTRQTDYVPRPMETWRRSCVNFIITLVISLTTNVLKTQIRLYWRHGHVHNYERTLKIFIELNTSHAIRLDLLLLPAGHDSFSCGRQNTRRFRNFQEGRTLQARIKVYWVNWKLTLCTGILIASKTVPQHLHIAWRVMATVHIGCGTE